MKHAHIFAALAVLTIATPVVARSEDLLLACKITHDDNPANVGNEFHVDVNFATQAVSLTLPNGDVETFQNGTTVYIQSLGTYDTYATITGTRIAFGKKSQALNSLTYDNSIDRTTGVLAVAKMNGGNAISTCAAESRATKF